MTEFGPIRKPRLRYAPKRAIDRAVEAVRANGIFVESVTFGPDGSFKLNAVDNTAQRSQSLFDALDQEGRL